jgi:hypothetical protein
MRQPWFFADRLLVDSGPVESTRLRETARRSDGSGLDDRLANAADCGYFASH